ncbi:MAG: VOC family protein [Thiobacillaceae bacterium]
MTQPGPVLGLGHAVLKVRNLALALAFYRDVLGLKAVARHRDLVFLSGGARHHDLALVQTRTTEPAPADGAPGLHHLAFKVGDDLATLRAWRDRLLALDIRILGQSDHRVSQSLYLRDPDGLLVELYVDADPALWRDDPSAVAHVAPLEF